MTRESWIRIIGSDIDDIFRVTTTSSRIFFAEGFSGRPGVYKVVGDLFKEGVSENFKAEFRINQNNGEFTVIDSDNNLNQPASEATT